MTYREEIEAILNTYAYKIATQIWEYHNAEVKQLKSEITRLRNKLEAKDDGLLVKQNEEFKKDCKRYRNMAQKLKLRNNNLESQIERLNMELKRRKI